MRAIPARCGSESARQFDHDHGSGTLPVIKR